MLKRVEFNFQQFNNQLEEEIHSEENAEKDLLSSQMIIETSTSLENLYRVANLVRYDLLRVMEDSRTTLDQILSDDNMKKKMDNGGKFDPS